MSEQSGTPTGTEQMSLEDLFELEFTAKDPAPEEEEQEEGEPAVAVSADEKEEEEDSTEATEEKAEAKAEKETEKDKKDEEELEELEEKPAPEKKALELEQLDSQMVPIKVDGEERLVSVREARHGYMRLQDYTRKTTEVAQQRKEIDALKASYATALEKIHEQLKVLTGENRKPDPSLRETDPAEYAAQMYDYHSLVEYQRAVEAERNRLQAEKAREQEEELKKAVAAAQEKLLELLPSWKDPAVRTREQSLLSRFLLERGYSVEEVQNLIDPRAVVLIRDAYLLHQQRRKAQQKRPPAPAGTKEKPKTLPPKGNVAPPAGRHPDVKVRKALEKVPFGASIDDFAEALSLDPNL